MKFLHMFVIGLLAVLRIAAAVAGVMIWRDVSQLLGLVVIAFGTLLTFLAFKYDRRFECGLYGRQVPYTLEKLALLLPALLVVTSIANPLAVVVGLAIVVFEFSIGRAALLASIRQKVPLKISRFESIGLGLRVLAMLMLLFSTASVVLFIDSLIVIAAAAIAGLGALMTTVRRGSHSLVTA